MQSDLLRNYYADFIGWISWRRSLLMIAIVLATECFVLVPAYFSHERDVLDRLSIVGKATISSTFLSQSHSSVRDLLLHGSVIARNSIVRGGALYRSGGQLVGVFGERPSLPVSHLNDRRYLASEGRYEFVLSLEHSGLPLTIVNRVDATGLPQAVLNRLKQTAMIVLAFAIILIITCVAIKQRRSMEKRSERELREREKLMTGVVENSPSAIYLKDKHGRLLMVNKEYEQLNGVTREQVIGKTVAEIFPNVAADAMTAQDRQIIETKTVVRQLHEYLGPDGNPRTVSQTKFPIMDDDGEVVLIGGIGSDVTERQNFQKALVESERHYRRLIESIPGAVYVQVDGLIVFVNFAAQRMFGAESSEELVGLASTNLFHADDREKIAARRKTARLSDETMPFIEVRHVRLNGTVFEGESTSTKIVWEGGPAILVEIRDITDRKIAERIAQKNQDQYRKFMELMPDAVFIHCNDEIVFANPAAVKMFGAKSTDDIVGASALGFSHKDDWEKIRARRLNIQKGRSWKDVEENRYIRLDGVEFQGESRANHITWNNEPGLLVAVRDITERKEIEAALENAKTAAETSNRTKSEFLANMSHELRTPLNAVIGFSEIFMQQMMGPLGNDKYQDYATDIHNSGKHLLNLINDILDISKIESGEARLFEEDIEIAGIVDSTLRLLETRANTNQVEIVVDIDANLPLLRADQRKLKQILINLISNAVKFSNPGGQVNARIWSAIDSGFVIQIEDSGIGIALQDIPKALAPFQQVDSDLNRNYDGTGLGLPLTKSLVELHGGSLNLDSQIGVGTTVTVRFPASRIVSESEFMDATDLDISGVA
jgi:PAS domain S-box-containing protein